ncbi:MAG: proton-conducting transporter membrane subunit, partial [Hyphomonadaceae bacterium]
MIAEAAAAARASASAILVFAPLIAAALAFALQRHRAAWLVASMLSLAAAGASLLLSPRFSAAPFGLHVDAIAVAAAPIVAIAGAACVLACGHLARADAGAGAAAHMIALLELACFGWLGALLANDLLSLFVFLSVGAIASCAMTALGAERDRAALSASLRMLTWCAAAVLAFALGAALVFNAAGTFDLAEIAAVAGEGARARSFAAGFALMIGGACALAGAAPLNLWMAAAFSRGARIASLAWASAGAIAALIVVARLALAADLGDAGLARGVSAALAALGAASVAIGSIQAIGASDLRRLVAYAGAAQTGMVLIALSFASPAGHAAALMHVAAQSLIALGLLGGAAVIEGRAPLAALDGFARRAPLAGAAMSIGALSLIGAPLTIGFLSRWRLIEASLSVAGWWAAGVIIAASLAAVFYGGRLIERLYARRGVELERDPWRVS